MTNTNKKMVTVYQAATQEDFIYNMRAGFGRPYLEVSKMEIVMMFKDIGSDDEILARTFYRMNEPSDYLRNYSMSTGDVVRINDVYYRCEPTGWSVI